MNTDSLKDSIKITTKVHYLANQSNPEYDQYAFAYTITISNRSDVGIQLLSRYWLINDDEGGSEEVIGKGVLGQQPHIPAGMSFEYSSGAMIKTITGTMQGHYSMVDNAGNRFDVAVLPFILSQPYTLH